MRCVLIGAQVRVGKLPETKGAKAPEYGSLKVILADVPKVGDTGRFVGCSVESIECSPLLADIAMEALRQTPGGCPAFLHMDVQLWGRPGEQGGRKSATDGLFFDSPFKITSAGIDFLEKDNVYLCLPKSGIQPSKRQPVKAS